MRLFRNLTMRTKKLLFSFCLFFTSFVAYADMVQAHYTLTNTSAASIPSPIHVTGAFIEYYFPGAGTANSSQCPGDNNRAKVDLGLVAPMPLPVYHEEEGTAANFTFTMDVSTDPIMQTCFKDFGSVRIT